MLAILCCANAYESEGQRCEETKVKSNFNRLIDNRLNGEKSVHSERSSAQTLAIASEQHIELLREHVFRAENQILIHEKSVVCIKEID